MPCGPNDTNEKLPQEIHFMQQNERFENFKSYFYNLPNTEKAGFFLWPSLYGDELTEEEIELLKRIKPSGVIFFKRNLKTVEQSQKLVFKIKNLIEHKDSQYFKTAIFSIDEEGGRVSRLPVEGIRGRAPLQYVESGDKNALEKQIEQQCLVSKEIGINCLLAPVADILTESHNPVMGDRCYGKDEKTVSEYSCFVNQIILSHKLLSCAKHFPGHGNTLTDSHKTFAKSDVSLNQLKSREWIPFQKLIEANVPLIMAAHVLLPQVDPKFPATLSSKILTEQLKMELGFQGLILSDDLRMNAIALHYQVDKKQDSFIEESDVQQKKFKPEMYVDSEDDFYLRQASLDALTAGCDILLSCQSIVRENIIVETLAQEMERSQEFLEQMAQKAWRIYQCFSKME